MNDKNKKLQAKIARLVKAGKPLGGLLAGMMATTTLAGSETNAVPRLAGVPLPGKPLPIAMTNASRQVKVRSVRGARPLMGKVSVSRSSQEVKQLPVSVSKGKYRVVYGDTLSLIAKRFGTTVAELKKLNGFDDMRANAIKVDEVLLVPVPATPSGKVDE